MQRVLDIDLDFFVREVVYWPDQTTRPDSQDHPVWEVDDALGFLQQRCRLERRLPGFVTENHGELFPLWRAAIEDGLLVPPFHLTHVDAHADLGLGDAGYVYLLTELVRMAPQDRTRPRIGDDALNDGNHLAFAIACRWIAELDYIYCDGGGSDELHLVMQGFDRHAAHVQLPVLTLAEVNRVLQQGGLPVAESFEPPVPYRSRCWDLFQAEAPYDFVCLTRSPPYSPPTADPLFDQIRSAFIEDQIAPRRP